MAVEPANEDNAYRAPAFPCNVRPFLRRMDKIMDQAGTTNPGSLDHDSLMRFRANLYIVLGITHGQTGRVDMFEEYQALVAYEFTQGKGTIAVTSKEES